MTETSTRFRCISFGGEVLLAYLEQRHGGQPMFREARGRGASFRLSLPTCLSAQAWLCVREAARDHDAARETLACATHLTTP